MDRDAPSPLITVHTSMWGPQRYKRRVIRIALVLGCLLSATLIAIGFSGRLFIDPFAIAKLRRAYRHSSISSKLSSVLIYKDGKFQGCGTLARETNTVFTALHLFEAGSPPGLYSFVNLSEPRLAHHPISSVWPTMELYKEVAICRPGPQRPIKGFFKNANFTKRGIHLKAPKDLKAINILTGKEDPCAGLLLTPRDGLVPSQIDIYFNRLIRSGQSGSGFYLSNGTLAVLSGSVGTGTFSEQMGIAKDSSLIRTYPHIAACNAVPLSINEAVGPVVKQLAENETAYHLAHQAIMQEYKVLELIPRICLDEEADLPISEATEAEFRNAFQNVRKAYKELETRFGFKLLPNKASFMCLWIFILRTKDDQHATNISSYMHATYPDDLDVLNLARLTNLKFKKDYAIQPDRLDEIARIQREILDTPARIKR